MAGSDPARGGLRGSLAESLKRQRDLESFGRTAGAAAREAYDDATRIGDLVLRTPGEILQYGKGLLGGNRRQGIRSNSTPRAAAAPGARPGISNPPAAGRPPQTGGPPPNGWLDDNALARELAGEAARSAGVVPGAARGAWHTAKGVVGGVNFISRLLDPYDAENSPPGEAAWDRVVNFGRGVADYAGEAISNPGKVANDVGAGLGQVQVRTHPEASPPARTFAGEVGRNFNIGLNQGELGFDLGSLVSGGAAAKGLVGLGKLSKEAGAAKYLARGYPTGISEYFATPYRGGGHHFLPQRTQLPSWLGGGLVPPAISNSPFLLLKPEGISTGDFYGLHVGVDPFYQGGKVPARFGGGGWSGKTLGWPKYGPLGRLWYGSPTPLKAAAGGGLLGAGAVVDQYSNGEAPQ